MDNKIIEFLINNNARIINGDKWLVAEEKNTCYVFTVLQREYRKKKTVTLFDGINLKEALRILSGKKVEV